MSKRALKPTLRPLWGRKGGESHPPGRDASGEDYWWIPKSLPSGLRGKPPEWLSIVLWMMWLTWEEARRRNEAGMPETDFYVVASAEVLAEGTGLAQTVIEACLADMAAAGFLEAVSEGWRLVRWSDEPGP